MSERSKQHREPVPLSKITDNTNPLIWVLQVFAMPSEIYLRRKFGCRYFGSRGLAAMIVFAIFLACYPQYDAMPLTRFFGGFLALFLIARLAAVYRLWRGTNQHSHYDGLPWCRRLLPHWREKSVKRLEAVFVVLCGASIKVNWNPPLGQFLMFSGASMLALMLTYHFIRRLRAVDMNDSRIDQQEVSEHFQQVQPV